MKKMKKIVQFNSDGCYCIATFRETAWYLTTILEDDERDMHHYQFSYKNGDPRDMVSAWARNVENEGALHTLMQMKPKELYK